MRKLKIIEHISLDGVIQAPGGPNEDGDYPYGGWTLPYRDPAAGKAVLAAHSEPFDLLLGRHLVGLLAEGTEQPAREQPECGHEIRRYPQA
jgi:hypothetical protein